MLNFKTNRKKLEFLCQINETFKQTMYLYNTQTNKLELNINLV